MTLADWYPLVPLIWLFLGGLVVMMADAFIEEKAELSMLSASVLTIGGTLSVVLWLNQGEGAVAPWISAYVATDKMSLFSDIVICAGAALSALLAGGYLREHELERGEFYPLLIFSALGAMVLARASDLLTVFLGLETMSLGVYALVAFRKTSPRATEGAIKYFLFGSFAAAILLFGSALLYGATGHTDFSGIRAGLASGSADPKLVSLSMLMLLAGLAFKVSAVPFHMWTPDAYEGAVTPATTFMAVAVKSAAFVVFVRFAAIVFSDELSMSNAGGWPPAVAGLAVVTMVYGNLAALNQTSVKRMLAYSSIAHAGYVLVAIAAVSRVGDLGTSAVLYYLLAYTVSNALAFGSLILMGSKGKEAVSYEDLAGIGRRRPMAALPFVLGVISLMGIPPTAGFFGKYYAFHAAVQAGGGFVWLAVIGVISSAIGAYYYLRVIVFMYMKEPQPGAPIALPMRSGYVAAALVLSSYFVLRMGITPNRYLDMAVEAAKSIAA